MSRFLALVLCSVLYGSTVLSAPVSDASSGSSSASPTLDATHTSSSAAMPSPTVPYASDDPNYWLWNSTETTSDPQPQRGTLGGNIMGPQNVEMDRQNPDILAPPTTDSGTVYAVAAYDCEYCR